MKKNLSFLDFSMVLDFIFPQFCLVCDENLQKQEEHLCWACISDLEFTENHYYTQNEITDLLVSHAEIQKAASFMIYKPGGVLQRMIYQLKYKENKEIGLWLGKQMALHMASWLNDIDLIVPTPIHNKRKALRGYNQSEVIAKGISAESGIQINTTDLIKKVHNTSQTNKTKLERIANVANVFELKRKHTLDNKNILLLDDVITTGSTTLSCISEILRGARPASISALFVASQNYT